MYKNILVATDGSELSNQAIEYAVALAKAVNSKLTVLTITMPISGIILQASVPPTKIENYEHEVAKLAEQYLDVAKNAAAAAEVPCHAIRVESTHPYQAIINVAKKQGCDLIVMASHGRRGVAAIVLGSETIKVLTHSTIPVLVVRSKTESLAES